MLETEIMSTIDKLTQEQYADLKQLVPESDMVKMVFENLIGLKIDDWDKAVEQMVESTLDGDPDALFDLLELVRSSAHNEGMLEADASA